ncbi:hypothetical protein F1188_13680 [Roseospira marina]|uniref:Uncharacterized protein n=1 Tax=Roseospira marina TaxID=140057 RepID=A0A5M6I9F5_9PROT|nr:hypothetical protein [Roseospira marina]KAA5604871.1 hypothetical protein F1188_13680 [Roseospira marina]MBB4315205.1 glucose uptake protein GlcU [Roseospira marina]MBB5088205.1 glucose uptake protein GlcU [Roseospira marina]
MSNGRVGAYGLGLAAAVGLGLALYTYATPLTGVTGTAGAAIAIALATAVLVSAVGLVVSRRPGWRNVLHALAFVALVGTAIAAFFLHEWGVLVAMALGLMALLVSLTGIGARTHSRTEVSG